MKMIHIMFLSAAIVTSNCVSSYGFFEREHEEVLTPREYVRNIDKYDGKTVVMRGYLRPLLPNMHIAEGHIPKPNEPTAFVYDSTPDRSLGNPINAKNEYQCADNYVELRGVSGIIELYKLRGIAEIQSIRVFEDGSLTGDGELCYSAEHSP